MPNEYASQIHFTIATVNYAKCNGSMTTTANNPIQSETVHD